MRLISREDAKRIIDNIDTFCAGWRDYAKEQIENLPTIDPVKHGRWIHDGQHHRGGVDWMHCSECGNTDVFGAKSMYHYCPNCGARMEGEEDEERLDATEQG